MVSFPTQCDGTQIAHLDNSACQTRGTSGEVTTFEPDDSDSDSILSVSSFNDSSELRPSVNKARRMAPARSRLSKDFSSAEKKKSFDELRNDASCSDALTLTAQKYSCYSRSWNYRNEVLTPGLLSGNRWRANGLIRQ
eukprot:GEMP01065322.1.p1 GENE.GEMP01065322.1~~GEMP01065322.1.p1  ORF type:complete len:138 (+),score=13.34 GEMP01065322.1:138-551(+)